MWHEWFGGKTEEKRGVGNFLLFHGKMIVKCVSRKEFERLSTGLIWQ
jgi:hypothetical protein